MALDYTYAERWGRDGNKYATPLDESTAGAVVAALVENPNTTGYLEILSDKLATDDEFIPAVTTAVGVALAADTDYLNAIGDNLEADTDLMAAIGVALAADTDYLNAIGDNLEADTDLMAAIGVALAADDVYREGIADYLATDAEYLAGVATAVAGELVSTFDTAVTGEIAHIGPADAVTLTVSDTGLDNLGDNGVVPGSVTFTITANDDSETLAVTDSDNGDGTGNLSGTGVGISVADDGVSTITYATGAWTITASEALKENEDILVDYDYSRDALIGDVGLTDGALAAIAAELAGDAAFLAAIAAELYVSEAPLDSADFTISAEAATNAETVDVTIQLKDADDVAFAQRTVVSVWFTSDANGTIPADIPAQPVFTGEGGFTAAGGILEEITALKSYTMITDATGKIAFQIIDPAGADLTAYCIVMLPNGKVVVGADDLLWASV